jgi:RNA polymerase sigma-70 factor, ECF subfamily
MASGNGVSCVSIDDTYVPHTAPKTKVMGTVEGQFVGWLEAEAVANPEQDTHAQVTSLVQEYSTTLYRVAYSVTRNAADAEDVVQETFLRVLKHRNKLAEVRDYRVWLVRITWNLVLDRKRRAKTRPEVDDFEDLARVLPTGELSAEKSVITAQRYARILLLIDTLPKREREVLLLSAVQELSTVEIALVLKTTESTIRSRLYRARHALAALLEQEGTLQ